MLGNTIHVTQVKDLEIFSLKSEIIYGDKSILWEILINK